MPNLHLQLYSLRREMESAPEETLRMVPSLGFDGVELAGRYGWDAGRWKELLTETGLSVVSAHVALKEIEDGLEESAAFYRDIGCPALVVPAAPEELRTPEGYKEFAARLNASARTLSENGFACGYHNHAFEFEELADGSRGMGTLLAGTDPSLVRFQFDTFWLERAGYDALEFLHRHDARIGSIHAKELRKSDDSDVSAGQGDVDFKNIIPLAVEHDWSIIVECENDNALESVKEGARYLRTLF